MEPPLEDRRRRRRAVEREPLLVAAGAWPSPEVSALASAASAAASGGAGWSCLSCFWEALVAVAAVVPAARDPPRPRPRLPRRRRRDRGRGSAGPCPDSAGGPGVSSVMPRSFRPGEPVAPFRQEDRATRVAPGDAGLGARCRHVICSCDQHGNGSTQCGTRTEVRGPGRRSGHLKPDGSDRGISRGQRLKDSRDRPQDLGTGYLNLRMCTLSSRPTAIQFTIMDVPP